QLEHDRLQRSARSALGGSTRTQRAKRLTEPIVSALRAPTPLPAEAAERTLPPATRTGPPQTRSRWRPDIDARDDMPPHRPRREARHRACTFGDRPESPCEMASARV